LNDVRDRGPYRRVLLGGFRPPVHHQMDARCLRRVLAGGSETARWKARQNDYLHLRQLYFGVFARRLLMDAAAMGLVEIAADVPMGYRIVRRSGFGMDC